MSSEPGRPIPYLENVALEFPELRIVAGHIGAPWTQEIIFLATKFPNLYIDTSAYKATRFPADFVEFMRGRGAKKVMFGTNYPMRILLPSRIFSGTATSKPLSATAGYPISRCRGITSRPWR